jgi:hypothetical protein
MYILIKPQAEYVMNGSELLKGAMNPEEFARGVVSHALKKNPAPRFWYGGSSALVWFITTFFKHTFLVSAIFSIVCLKSNLDRIPRLAKIVGFLNLKRCWPKRKVNKNRQMRVDYFMIVVRGHILHIIGIKLSQFR